MFVVEAWVAWVADLSQSMMDVGLHIAMRLQ